MSPAATPSNKTLVPRNSTIGHGPSAEALPLGLAGRGGASLAEKYTGKLTFTGITGFGKTIAAKVSRTQLVAAWSESVTGVPSSLTVPSLVMVKVARTEPSSLAFAARAFS